MALYPCNVGGNQPKKLNHYSDNQASISIDHIPNFRARTFYLANIKAVATSCSVLDKRHGNSVASALGTTITLTKNGSSLSVTGARQTVQEVAGWSEGDTTRAAIQLFEYDIYYV